MSRNLESRLHRLEETHAAPPRPWLILKPGETAPNPLPKRYGGIVRIQVFDGRIKPA